MRRSVRIVSAGVSAMMLPLLAAADGRAQQAPNGWSATGRCACMCTTGNNFEVLIYDMVGGACFWFDGKTCNYDDGTGLVRSGRLRGCEDEYAEDAASGQRFDMLDPGGQGGAGPQIFEGQVFTIDPNATLNGGDQANGFPQMQVAPGLERLVPSQ